MHDERRRRCTFACRRRERASERDEWVAREEVGETVEACPGGAPGRRRGRRRCARSMSRPASRTRSTIRSRSPAARARRRARAGSGTPPSATATTATRRRRARASTRSRARWSVRRDAAATPGAAVPRRRRRRPRRSDPRSRGRDGDDDEPRRRGVVRGGRLERQLLGWRRVQVLDGVPRHLRQDPASRRTCASSRRRAPSSTSSPFARLPERDEHALAGVAVDVDVRAAVRPRRCPGSGPPCRSARRSRHPR